MSLIKIFLFLFILSISSVDSRTLRERRHMPRNQVGQDVNNYMTNGFNTIRDTVVPVISSTADRLSQYWDRYKQNVNQGINQIGQGWDQYKQNINQGWNQFTQNFNPQYPPYDQRNYAYNQYGYNPQQYPINNNYNIPQNMYQNYNGGRQGNPYVGNNNYNSYGNIPYNTGNTGGQWYRSFGGQQQANSPIVPYPAMYNNQRQRLRR
ncbi:unnamed protein product [Adineta steineri]|uniref:Uncharacterized protein n=2 Tax=Adineta steineri TaxID=433720 RepID=A0A818XMH9_9BILA|nr:unnamed protein product [Adineta steineri]